MYKRNDVRGGQGSSNQEGKGTEAV